MEEVTLVITSCGRFDLLKRTLDSFFEKNTYPIKKIIITEDSTEGKKLENLISQYENKYNFCLIINETREGQLKSIDKAYNEVDTEYVFHCEDDWEFLREGFIEKSMEMLKEDPKIAVVGLRSREDCSGIPISKENYKASNGEEYFEILEDVFTYNPGLRRKSDHDLFGSHEKLKDKLYEMELSKFYKDRNYRTIYFKEKYVKFLRIDIEFSKKA